jgi:quinol monooxygenase YgiN
MRPFLGLSLGLVILAAVAAGPVRADDNAVYVVTYVDVMPNSVTPGAALLQKYRSASREENGNLRFDVLQEISRPNRFAVLEVWRDKAAADAHGKATSTADFRDKLEAIENAPYDERVNNGLYVAPLKNENRPDAIYVVTHVDVIPPGKDDCMAGLKAMSVDTPNDPGNISYGVLQQTNRSNHFSVVEAWTDRKGLDGHAMAAHTRAFRERLSPIAGALYDERFYSALN